MKYSELRTGDKLVSKDGRTIWICTESGKTLFNPENGLTSGLAIPHTEILSWDVIRASEPTVTLSELKAHATAGSTLDDVLKAIDPDRRPVSVVLEAREVKYVLGRLTNVPNAWKPIVDKLKAALDD